MIKIVWSSFLHDHVEETEVKGKSLQITHLALRDEDGNVIAHYDHGPRAWVRLDDMSEWTDIAW